MSRILVVLLFLSAAAADAAAPLTLAEAMRLALERDPVVRQAEARASAYADDAVADAALPDPELMAGIGERPLRAADGMDMAMYEVGVMQRIPPRAARRSMARRGERLADAERMLADDRRLALHAAVTEAWLELLHMHEAVDVLRETRAQTAALAETVAARHGRGAARRGDVIDVELELARIDELDSRARRDLGVARASLARLVGGEHAARPLDRSAPMLPEPGSAQALRDALPSHPRVLGAAARIEAGHADEAAERGMTRPEFGLSASYMRRSGRLGGMEMPDAVGARATVSLPLFTANRQDRRIAAAKARTWEAQAMRDAELYDLEYMLERAAATAVELREQRALYESRLLPSLAERAETAENAYRAGAGDITEVLRARIAELDARLELHGILLDLQRVRAELLYLTGETP